MYLISIQIFGVPLDKFLEPSKGEVILTDTPSQTGNVDADDSGGVTIPIEYSGMDYSLVCSVSSEDLNT